MISQLVFKVCMTALMDDCQIQTLPGEPWRGPGSYQDCEDERRRIKVETDKNPKFFVDMWCESTPSGE